MAKLLERLLEAGLILGILYLAGCQTVKGVAGDSAWLLQKASDNIVVEQD